MCVWLVSFLTSVSENVCVCLRREGEGNSVNMTASVIYLISLKN